MGAVYVVTNGFSTADDASGIVVFDPDGGPPGSAVGGSGSGALPSNVPALPPSGTVLPPRPSPVATRWAGRAVRHRPATAEPLDPVRALDLVLSDWRY